LGLIVLRQVPARISIAMAAVAFTIVGFFAASGLLTDDLLASVSRSGDANEMYQFTGRTDVWQYVIERIGEKPLTGYGYACSRFVMAEYNQMLGDDLVGFHAHNTLLNIALATGVVGGSLLVLMVLQQAFYLLTLPAIFPDVVLLLIGTAGIADAVAFSPIPDAFTVIWLLALFWRQSGASLHDDANRRWEAVTS
ncbi:MAG TPA: O-antigen ligase family protein, partial [Pirellulales bacterium]|nr:O-antigen ligase family protein [Pirellulales bacterium]